MRLVAARRLWKESFPATNSGRGLAGFGHQIVVRNVHEPLFRTCHHTALTGLRR
jgi:hypothetical protein